MGIPRVFLIPLYTSKSAFHFKSLQQFLSSVLLYYRKLSKDTLVAQDLFQISLLRSAACVLIKIATPDKTYILPQRFNFRSENSQRNSIWSLVLTVQLENIAYLHSQFSQDSTHQLIANLRRSEKIIANKATELRREVFLGG